MKAEGDPLPKATLDSIRRTRLVTEAQRPKDVSVEVAPGSRVAGVASIITLSAIAGAVIAGGSLGGMLAARAVAVAQRR